MSSLARSLHPRTDELCMTHALLALLTMDAAVYTYFYSILALDMFAVGRWHVPTAILTAIRSFFFCEAEFASGGQGPDLASKPWIGWMTYPAVGVSLCSVALPVGTGRAGNSGEPVKRCIRGAQVCVQLSSSAVPQQF